MQAELPQLQPLVRTPTARVGGAPHGEGRVSASVSERSEDRETPCLRVPLDQVPHDVDC